jgi:phospholipase A1/A2
MTRYSVILSGAILFIIMAGTSFGAERPADDFQLIQTGPGLSLHKEMFMMPVTISNEYDGSQTEAMFQMSAKHRIFESRLYFGYAQISFWQSYDHHNSAPFRETNYNPELFFRAKRFPFYSGQIGADIGIEHESNGQRLPLSRSWNLFYVSPYYCSANWLLHLKLRYRFPEDDKKSIDDPLGDDNPDITDYLGYSDIQLYYRLPWHHILHLTLRGVIGNGKGEIIMNYSALIPKGKYSYLCVRVSHGYGESLVDYKKSLTRIGFGIMFSR